MGEQPREMVTGRIDKFGGCRRGSSASSRAEPMPLEIRTNLRTRAYPGSLLIIRADIRAKWSRATQRTSLVVSLQTRFPSTVVFW